MAHEQVYRELGVPGVALEAGDHVCGFYFGDAERDAILLPYLRAGVRDGDLCLGVLDTVSTADVRAQVGETGDGQLRLWGSAETYLLGGTFQPRRMIAFWEEQTAGAADEGYRFTRVVGEMSWLERAGPDRESVVAYEQWAHRFAPRHPQALLCLYDLARLGSGIMVDLLKTHPKLLLGGMVLENPHHLSHDEFLAARR